VNDVNGEAGLAQTALNARREPAVVLDQQHSHPLQYPWGG
jgi:hypothetical protein